MQVQNPGGGIASAVTDGVTITGNGLNASPIALLAVQTDSSLAGAGIASSKLHVPPVTSFQFGSKTNTHWAGIANAVQLLSFVLPCAVTFSRLAINILTGDSSGNKYDYGIYNSAGTLLADVSPDGTNGFTPLGSNVIVDQPVFQGSTTLLPGRYYFAWTGNSATGNLDGGPLSPGSGSPGGFYTMFCSGTSSGATTNGHLSSTVTPPSDSLTYAGVCLMFH